MIVSGICMFKFLKKRFKGVAILETVLTLPIIMWLLFATIELIRIGLAQVAVDSITRECSLALMGKGNKVFDKVDGEYEFDTIFNKYKPMTIPIGNFRYYISLYKNIDQMMSVEPYGGETIGWAGSDFRNVNKNASPTMQAIDNNFELKSGHPKLLKYRTKLGSEIDSSSSRQIGEITKSLLGGEDSGSYTFVLTVAVKFPFSSSFVAKLFNGGTNTELRSNEDADSFILWSRGVGMMEIYKASAEG